MSVRNVLDWLEEAARLAPEATAFDSPERRLAWAQARGLARRAGSRLASLIPPQSPVLILMEKSPECLCAMLGTAYAGCFLLGLDSDTFYIYHVAAVMVDNLRRLLLGINLSDKAIMDFDFPGVGFPV